MKLGLTVQQRQSVLNSLQILRTRTIIAFGKNNFKENRCGYTQPSKTCSFQNCDPAFYSVKSTAELKTHTNVFHCRKQTLDKKIVHLSSATTRSHNVPFTTSFLLPHDGAWVQRPPVPQFCYPTGHHSPSHEVRPGGYPGSWLAKSSAQRLAGWQR